MYNLRKYIIYFFGKRIKSIARQQFHVEIMACTLFETLKCEK